MDRVVLRAYVQLGQRAAVFRMWWRRWQGSDEGLDNARLMRVAGRFAPRVKAWAKREGVPTDQGFLKLATSTNVFGILRDGTRSGMPDRPRRGVSRAGGTFRRALKLLP